MYAKLYLCDHDKPKLMLDLTYDSILISNSPNVHLDRDMCTCSYGIKSWDYHAKEIHMNLGHLYSVKNKFTNYK